jgi:hypothetical protein
MKSVRRLGWFNDPLIEEIFDHRISLVPLVIWGCALWIVAWSLLTFFELDVMDNPVGQTKVIFL